MLGGTPTPAGLPGQQIPNMVESAINGIKITRAAIASRQEAAAEAANVAASTVAKKQSDNLLNLMKEIDKGKYLDTNQPYTPQTKLELKEKAWREFGFGQQQGQGSYDPRVLTELYGRNNVLQGNVGSDFFNVKDPRGATGSSTATPGATQQPPPAPVNQRSPTNQAAPPAPIQKQRRDEIDDTIDRLAPGTGLYQPPGTVPNLAYAPIQPNLPTSGYFNGLPAAPFSYAS
jgi:hypothetical protein